MTRFVASTSAVAVAALLAGAAYYAYGPNAAPNLANCSQAAVAGGAIGGAFELVSEDGVTVTDQDVITKPTILYFGYTFCPDVCPLDNMRNADAQRILDEQGYDVQTAFISIDPERDTPEVMKEFTSLFHDNMIGLTGSPEQVKAASKAYKTYYQKEADGDPEYYLMDHSTQTYFVMPEVGFVDFFKRDDSPEKLAETVACFVDEIS
ncbi:protein SCO1/2 [Pacificibacter maritimus]|uniref:Protein SCO1/2 n=1 Tax=Pacificibacter maritimus TaxID=762213 RepID=A0A3N4USS4_9RHOB|nr:SCO family protein [Pacificibacter maritimus]RPE64740.1 protein SCO1/2 [Pacificibacter maritimus]